MTHTKGPWKANLHHTTTQAGRTYAMVMADGIVPVAAVVLGVEGCGEEEGRANAHLIEAAPDMQEALKALNLAYRGIPFAASPKQLPALQAASEMAAAALAKAEGSAPKDSGPSNARPKGSS